MPTGAITGYIDVAQLTLYAFWIFFAGLIFYLRREDKREGYPLESEASGMATTTQGFPPLPSPKAFLLSDGHVVYAPRVEMPQPLPPGEPTSDYLGAPMVPIGNPMIQSIGPASYVERAAHPDMMLEGGPKLVPLRVAPEYWLNEEDPNPVGMTVVGADGVVAGTCKDAWIDRSEMLVRYLEVSVAGMPRDVLVPMTLVRISQTEGVIAVASVMAAQFAEAPVLAMPDQITLREEDRVSSYFASGHLYATPSRVGPLL